MNPERMAPAQKTAKGELERRDQLLPLQVPISRRAQTSYPHSIDNVPRQAYIPAVHSQNPERQYKVGDHVTVSLSSGRSSLPP